jgi:hypothetical protein
MAAVVEDRRLGMEEDIRVRLDGNEMVVVAVAVDPIERSRRIRRRPTWKR